MTRRLLRSPSPLAAGLVLLAGCILRYPADKADSSESGGDSSVVSGDPTWYKDIHPMMQEHCAGCHSAESSIGGFLFDSYEQVKALAPTLMLPKIVGDDTPTYNMPPFPPPDTHDDCKIPGPIKDDPRLTAEEIAAFQKWLEIGMPEGDPSTDPNVTPMKAPVLAGEGVVQYPGIDHNVPAATDGGDIDHTQCFSVNIASAGPVLLNALQVMTDPNHPNIVHHVIVGTDPSGMSYPNPSQGYNSCSDKDYGTAHPGHEDADDGMFHECETDCIADSLLLYTYTPGGYPLYFPDNSAYELPQGARLTFTVHYHRGPEQIDGDMTTLLARYTDEKPEFMAYMDRFGAASTGQKGWDYSVRHKDGGWDTEAGSAIPFDLKADDPDYHMVWKEDNSLPADYHMWSVFPHMHYAASSIRISLEHPDGTEDCLAKIDPWDFNWQLTYVYDLPFDDLPVFQGDSDYVDQSKDGPDEGDTVKIDCHYNNTWDNVRLRDEGLIPNGYKAPIDMAVGEGSLNEMCVMHYGLIMPFDEAPSSN